MSSPVIFLDASSSTDATTGKKLELGTWKFSLDSTNGDVAVIIDCKPPGGTNFMPVTKGGSAVSLNIFEPFVMETSAGGTYRVTASNGSPTNTVKAHKVPSILPTMF